MSLASLLEYEQVDSARYSHCSSSSWSKSHSLTELVGGGIRFTSMLVKAGRGGFLGQWLANVGAIDTSSSGSIQAGANGGAMVVQADTV